MFGTIVNLIIISVIAGLAVFLYRFFSALKNVYYPFARQAMITRCQCLKCKEEFDKTFVDFEYVYQIYDGDCPDCGEGQKIQIVGIFYFVIKSKEQLKWEEWEKRFE